MKKFLALICVIAMLASISVAVFAEDTDNSHTVTGTYNGRESQPVYSVDIAWANFAFTYNSEYKGEWNANEHKYENGAPAGWVGQGTITITNHSNTDVGISIAYEQGTGYENADMNFSEKTLTIASADNGENGAAGTPVVKTVTVTPTGSLPEETNAQAIGTITITIDTNE